MILNWPPKDPDEVLDYSVDWSQRLRPGETIETSTFSITPSGLTKASDDYVGQRTRIWVSGGTDGTTYLVRNLITTSEGRTWDQTCSLVVKTNARP